MFKTKLCQRLLFDFALELALARLVKILHFSQPASLKLRSRRNGKRDFSCIETESGQTGATFWSLIKYLKMAKPPSSQKLSFRSTALGKQHVSFSRMRSEGFPFIVWGLDPCSPRVSCRVVVASSSGQVGSSSGR